MKYSIRMQSTQDLITNPDVPPWNKLRLVMLYALRYQKTQTANIASLINLALANGVSREDAKVAGFLCKKGVLLTDLQLVYVLLNVAGTDQRQDDLFSTESLLAKGRSALKGLKVGVTIYLYFSYILITMYIGCRKRVYPAYPAPFANPRESLQRPTKGDQLSIPRRRRHQCKSATVSNHLRAVRSSSLTTASDHRTSLSS